MLISVIVNYMVDSYYKP